MITALGFLLYCLFCYIVKWMEINIIDLLEFFHNINSYDKMIIRYDLEFIDDVS